MNEPEGACEQVIFSGGGFSNIFGVLSGRHVDFRPDSFYTAMPDYQVNHVQSYFDNHSPPYTEKTYNNSQTVRGYPDISAK